MPLVRGLLSLSGGLDPPELDYTETARLRESHARQREFLDSEAKRIVIRAGRPADSHAQERATTATWSWPRRWPCGLPGRLGPLSSSSSCSTSRGARMASKGLRVAAEG
jgi:hypothetical protein